MVNVNRAKEEVEVKPTPKADYVYYPVFDLLCNQVVTCWPSASSLLILSHNSWTNEIGGNFFHVGQTNTLL